MFDTIGYRVKELHRSRFGSLILKNMQKGEYKVISPKEIKKYNEFKYQFF